ncbi:hypothetical protein P5V15_005893 [Pogonomyrmex californicus]
MCSRPRMSIKRKIIHAEIVVKSDIHIDRLGNPTCFYCKEKGHCQFDCSALQNGERQGTRRQQTVQVAAAVFKAEEDAMVLVTDINSKVGAF